MLVVSDLRIVVVVENDLFNFNGLRYARMRRKNVNDVE